MDRPDPGRTLALGSGTGEAEGAGPDGLEVFPIAIGAYDHHQNLDVETAVQQVILALSEFGAREVGWPIAMADRGSDAVDARLRAWARPTVQADSVLYWVGHGWSDGTDVALAHAHSPAAVRTSGILPVQLAEPVRARQITAGGRWTIVVVDTCWSARFVDKVNAHLADGPIGADAVLLVGVSGDGAVSLGRLLTVLQACLQENFRADRTIALWQLAQELDRRLPHGLVIARRLADAALVRRAIPIAATISVSLDVLRELEESLARLSEDERRHFLVKAQGAEEGEISWFFEGRADERAQIVEWLRTTDCGLLIVTGRAGSGKSALLGHVLMHSLPDLREALVRGGLVDGLPSDQRPPDGVFDHVIHLTGITLQMLIQRIARASGVGEPPSRADPTAGYGTATDLDWLVDRLQKRSTSVTLLLDALDEAIDPLALAHTVLRRIVTIPGVRVLVGTRASTQESPDHPTPDDEDLLQALSAGYGTNWTIGEVRLVQVAHDRDAVIRYVTRRLTVARDRGNLTVDSQPVGDSMIHAAATTVGKRQCEFLFARLAVYEILADPSLLLPARSLTFNRLLAADHRDLFGAAVARLTRRSDSFLPLLDALALARGRGVPIRDGIWAVMATALAAGSSPGLITTDADISALLADAQPYIAVDAEAGQTVYRLAHRTFVEHFTARRRAPMSADRPSSVSRKQRRIGTALLAAAEGSPASRRNPYLVSNLSGHVADADLWSALAASPAALDSLDPYAVTADALRTIIGWAEVPPPIAGVIGARQPLARAEPTDRAGLRQLATSRYSRQQVNQEPTSTTAPWGVAAAAVGSLALHVLLAGHHGDVNCLCTVRGLQGRQLLASAGDDGAIRLWNPATANPVGAPLRGHVGPVRGVCSVPGPGGRVLLASAGADGTVRLWDPVTATALGAPLTGHTGQVQGVCSVPGPGGRVLLASAGADGTVRLWDPVTATALGAPLTGHTGTVWKVCTVPGRDGRVLLASAGTDGTVRLWDLAAANVANARLTGHSGPVIGVCTAPGPGGQMLLASAGADGTVRLWDPVTATALGAPLTGHTGPVWGVCAVPLPDKRVLLASAGGDGTVQLWDPVTATALGAPLTGHTGPIWGVCAVPLPDERVLLASGGADGTVRLWNPVTATALGAPLTGHTDPIWKVCAVPEPGGRVLLASGSNDGVIRLWDPSTATPVGTPLAGHSGAVAAVCMVPVPERALLASGGTDGTVRLWDPSTAAPVRTPMAGHSGTVTAVCALSVRGGRVLLASSGDDGTIRLWDPATATALGAPLTGHTGTIRELCAVPLPDERVLLASAGDDGTVRLWDPATATAVGPSLTGHTGPVEGVCALSVRGGRVLLASAGDDGTVRLWDPATATALGTPLAGHSGTVRGVCTMPVRGGQVLLASAGDDGTVRLWDPATATALGTPLAGHSGTVRGVCAMPVRGGQVLLASAGADGTIRLWDPATATAVGASLSGNPATVDAIAQCLGPGDRPLQATAGQGGSLRIWDPATARSVERLTGHSGAITAVSSLTDRAGAAVVATGGTDGTIRMLHPRRAAPSAPIHLGVGQVLAICTLPGEPGLVAVAGGDGTVTAWDLVAARQVRAPIPGRPGLIRALYVPDAPAHRNLLLSGGQDGTIRRWNISTWQPLGEPQSAHTGWVWCICAIDGPRRQPLRLASAGADGAVRLWDAATVDPVGDPLTGHTDQVRAVCQVRTADGRVLLASGAHDHTIRLWNPVNGAPIQTIPLGIPVHALSQHPRTERFDRQSDGGATLIVGTRDGILAINLHESLFPYYQE